MERPSEQAKHLAALEAKVNTLSLQLHLVRQALFRVHAGKSLRNINVDSFANVTTEEMKAATEQQPVLTPVPPPIEHAVELQLQPDPAVTVTSLANQTSTAYSEHNREIARLRAELEQIYSSKSWRITRPLRGLKAKINQLRAR